MSRRLPHFLFLMTAAFVLMTSSVSAQQPLAFERGPGLSITDAPRAIAAADVTGDGWTWPPR